MSEIVNPTNDYMPPSITDGTVDIQLVTDLIDLTDRFGVAGVRTTLDELFPPVAPPEWKTKLADIINELEGLS
jgi:hypothetical protein